jgi:menaquinone-specific isochorismate synthase
MSMNSPDTTVLRELIQHASRQAQSTGAEILASHTQRFDPIDPLDIFAAAESFTSDRWYWECPAENRAIASIGILSGLTPPRNVRFKEVARAIDQYASRAKTSTEPGIPETSPILFAAFSYDPKYLQDRLVWQGFPSTYLLTPRLTVIRDGADHTVTMNSTVSARIDPETLCEATEEFNEQLISALEKRRDADLIVDEIEPDKTNEKEVQQYVRAVNRAAAAIRNEDFDALTVARRRKLTTGGLYRINRMLKYLRDRFPESRIVAAGRHGSTFIGYAPTPVLRKRGNRVTARTSAGSIRRGDNPDLDAALTAQLANHPDDAEHHELCVEHLAEVLEQFAGEVDIPDEPEILTTSERHYLHTVLRAEVHANTNLLELIEALHPSVETTGLPITDASTFIHEEEQLDRGWYSAPFGWVDLNGDGEFVTPTHAVVVRAPVLDQQRAYLFTSTPVYSGADAENYISLTDRESEPLRTALRQ